MPIYEYYCDRCKKASSFLLLRATEEIEPYCKSCNTKDVRRILSRVSILKSEESRMESLLDPSRLSGLDENDPRSVEKLMKRMGRELGDELGEGFEQEMEEAMSESGSTPREDL
ncbi:MAG TPA: zinc ribbon domain-containing protein [Syntrophorhabdales bacterium]|nr:zinc ribbon domain-containing protein [Syntrophorhabdales bacterium]